MDLQTLTADFGLPGVLAFDEPHPGMTCLRITTSACTAEVYLHGAHLTQWQPTGEAPVLFLSELSAFAPDKPIRGGVPIVFPWFGPRTPSAANSRTDGPMHGFARLEDWKLAFAALSGEDLHLTLTLAPTDRARSLGFDHFRLAYQLILGRTLTMRLTVANEADSPLRFEEALHTYFHVDHAEHVRVLGLQNTTFIDKPDHSTRKVHTDPAITFGSEVDRPYLNTKSTVILLDPDIHHRILVAKEGSGTTVVWNPASAVSAKMADLGSEGWRCFVCIETANALENAVSLAPRSTHTMQAHVSVEKL